MTAAAWVALAAGTGLALADWVAVGSARRSAEYVLKPATLVALIALAVALDPQDGGQRAWFVAALVFSLAGDVFLMLPSDRFVEGLGSFLLAHLAYVVGLQIDGPSVGALALAAALVAVAAIPLGARIVRGVRDAGKRALVAPVVAYIAVISAMVVSALATGRPVAIAGALLFYASDACIGWSRFVHPFKGHRLAIMTTYHLGQAGLVLSLLG